MYDAVLAFVQTDIGPYRSISGFILWQQSAERSPGPQVRPTERSRKYIDFLCFFHYGIVYGNSFAGREQLFNRFIFLLRIEIGENTIEDLRYARSIYTHHGSDSTHIPYKNSCIPEVITLGQISVGSLPVRFFLECIYRKNLFISHDLISGSNISISGFRASRFDTQRYDSTAVVSKTKCFLYYPAEFTCIDNQCIRRSHHHIGVRMFFLDFPASIGDAGSSVSCTRLCKDIAFRNLRQLLPDDINIFLGRHYPHIFPWTDAIKTISSQLNQRTPASHYINKLLGTFRCTHRPKTTTDATSHNYDMIIHAHITPLF